MKKYLLAAIASICMYGTTKAQLRTIAIVQADTVIETESYLDGEGYAYLRNTTNGAIRVIVEREDLAITPGHIAYYCWGPSCYSPNVYISTDTVTIAALGTETSFKGYLSPSGVEGISRVKYCFKDITNNSTPTCIQMQYFMGVVSVNGKIQRKQGIYPNPATHAIVVKRSGLGKATYEIMDLQGRVLLQGAASADELVSVERLKSGLYQIRIHDAGHTYIESFMKK